MSTPSDRLLGRLFWRAGYTIFVLDPACDGIRYASRCACSLLGYEVDELLAMPLSALFRSEGGALEAFLETIEKQGDGWATTFALRTKTGAFLPVELLAFRFRSDEQRYVLVLANDRHDRGRLD